MTDWEDLYKAIRSDWERFLKAEGAAFILPQENASKPLINLWTMQMGKWRQAQAYEIKLVDITVKSGLVIFAPTWEVLMQYKRGEMQPPQYAEIYLSRMQASLRFYPEKWKRLQAYPKMALTCYCKAGEFCHRYLFSQMAEAYLTRAGFEVCPKGELTA